MATFEFQYNSILFIFLKKKAHSKLLLGETQILNMFRRSEYASPTILAH